MAILTAVKDLSVVLIEPNGLAADGTITAGVSTPGVRLEVWRTTEVTAVAAADEYIQTDLLSVISVSVVETGPAPGTAWNVLRNGNGTGDTEGDVAGGVGLESVAASAVGVLVNVVGTFDES